VSASCISGTLRASKDPIPCAPHRKSRPDWQKGRVKITVEPKNRPSLESLIESEDLGLEVLHPGGLEITRELAEFCHIGKETFVLDVASGTGESACYLAEQFGARVVGVDISDSMIARAEKKARQRRLAVEFKKGDAQKLPFGDNTFDAAISECTTCILDKERAIKEMVRVVKPGGYVGIHDVCWKEDTPEQMKGRLAELEGERPETLDGWKALFEKMGLVGVLTSNKSSLMPAWMKEFSARLGFSGQLKTILKIARKWGLRGLLNARETESIFRSAYTGYGIIVGKKTGG
jgi:arsenite methyltransferase